jgi:hypothetical protein
VDPKPNAAFGGKSTFAGMTICTQSHFCQETAFCLNDNLWIQNQKLFLAGNWFLLE